MEPHDSVSYWLEGVKDFDSLAAQRLWDRYFEQLVRLARGRLPIGVKRAADEEDVVLSAFQSFFRGAQQGQFPQLDDRDDLWKILVTITERKAWRHTQHERRQKRGGGAVLGESVFQQPDHSRDRRGLELHAAPEPTPEFAAQMADEVNHLLTVLDDEVLRQVAMQKLQGYTLEEIASSLGISTRSTKRKLSLIRDIWTTTATDV